MKLLVSVCCAFVGFVLAGKPPHTDVAGVARWQLHNANWGVLATRSVHLNGTAFGNPISVADAMGNGVPYFYVSMMDTSMQDLIADPRSTLTISEASIDCKALQLDPEDPRCVRLSLSGLMVNVTDEAEFAKARTELFKRHPPMKQWPSDHSWIIWKMDIKNIWLIDYFGGAVDLPIANYTAATPSTDMVTINATNKPSRSKPFFLRKTATARWLAHQSHWAGIATTSVHLNGVAFANTMSVVDGTADKSTGVPYMYVSDWDTSMQDLQKNPKCTLSYTEATVDCATGPDFLQLDPEDPRCVRLSLTGTVANVTDAAEIAFAKKGLISVYPDMANWPVSHGFHVVKLQIENIWLIDFFGGATIIAPKDYFAESLSSKKQPPYLSYV